MGEVLDKIMEASRTGRIEGWDKIEKILKEIAELSIKDMTAMLGSDIANLGKILTESFLNEEHGLELSQDVIEAVRLTEMLCLTDGTKMCASSGFFSEVIELKRNDLRRREPYWYTCMKLILFIFRKAQKIDALFRQFWCISLEDLREGLNTLDFIRHPKKEKEEKEEKEEREEREGSGGMNWEYFDFVVLDDMGHRLIPNGPCVEEGIYGDEEEECYSDEEEECYSDEEEEYYSDEEEEYYSDGEEEYYSDGEEECYSDVEEKYYSDGEEEYYSGEEEGYYSYGELFSDWKEEYCLDEEDCFDEEEDFDDMEGWIELTDIYDDGEEPQEDGEGKEKFYEELKKDFYMKGKSLQISLKSGTTLGEVLEQAGKVIEENWCPSKSIHAYATRVLTAYEVINFLLIESFRFWDPERFDMDAILGKYKK